MRYLLALLFIIWAANATAQTPNLNCGPATNTASAISEANTADDCLDVGGTGYELFTFASDANDTMTAAEFEAGVYFRVESPSLTATRTLTVPAEQRMVVFENATTGGQDITVTTGSGATVTIPPNVVIPLGIDGTDVFNLGNPVASPEITVQANGDLIPFYDISLDSMSNITIGDANTLSGGVGGSIGGDVAMGGMWEVIGTSSASGATTVDLTWRATTAYDYIAIYAYNLDFGTDGRGVAGRISIDGSTYRSTAGDYEWSYCYQVSATQDDCRAHGENSTERASDTCFHIGPDHDNTNDVSGWFQLRLWNYENTGQYAYIDFNMHGKEAGTSTEEVIGTHGGGQYDGSNDDIMGFQFFAHNADTSGCTQDGTISGEFYVVGFRREANALFTQQTTDATATEIYASDLASGESIGINVFVNALKSTGEVYSARIYNACRNNAGTTSCGTQVRDEIELGSVTAGVNVDIQADDTDDEAVVEITGAASETWDWRVRVEASRE